MWETDFGGPMFLVVVIVGFLVFLSIPVIIGVAVGGLAGGVIRGAGVGYGALKGLAFGIVSVPLNLLLTLSYFNLNANPYLLWAIAIPVSILLVIVAPIVAVKRKARVARAISGVGDDAFAGCGTTRKASVSTNSAFIHELTRRSANSLVSSLR